MTNLRVGNDLRDGLACPYLKHDPQTYGRRKTCRGSSFTSIHRLKTQKQKPNCPRCHEIFASESGVKNHLKSRTPCEVTQGPAVEGFNALQEKELRSKKRVPGVATDKDNWDRIFKVLFPDCVEMPSHAYNLRFWDDSSDDEENGCSSYDWHYWNYKSKNTIDPEVLSELRDEFYLGVEDAVGGSFTPERKRKLMDVSKDFAIKMLKHAKEDHGRDKGKGLPDVREVQESTIEPTAKLASNQVHEEGGSLSSILAKVSEWEGGNRGHGEAQPMAVQDISEANHPEGDLQHSILAGTSSFDELFGNFELNAEPDFNALFAAYEDQTISDWNHAAAPPFDAPGDVSGAVYEGEAAEIVRESR
ncbi:hypothetical protein CMUS01_11725 [Colletotrichum musicola]|uniref:C2H2-type domain-containing protein n=1 Tax=Colletotrichum musicola TaxID=2175873 RepID=A0A8H6JUH8_9PEZI|nr:hypothetical protein CMUS01_11725 [Colletotrichum musicola]